MGLHPACLLEETGGPKLKPLIHGKNTREKRQVAGEYRPMSAVHCTTMPQMLFSINKETLLLICCVEDKIHTNIHSMSTIYSMSMKIIIKGLEAEIDHIIMSQHTSAYVSVSTSYVG